MRVCLLKDLQPGMVLGKSLYNERGQLLLRTGFTLDSEVLRRLRETGRSAVYVHEDGTEDIIPEDIVAEETRSRTVQTFARAMEKVSEAAAYRTDIAPDKLGVVLQKGAEYRNVVDVDKLSTEITSIVDEIVDSSAQVLDQTLFKSRAGYDTEHAFDTTVITLLIGRRFLYPRSQLVELGMGALLHDIGKHVLPALLRKAIDELTDAEQLALREHPLFGRQMLANSTDRNFMAQTTILHHHERQDGLGYPFRLIGTNKKPFLNGQDSTKFIFPFAEIVAVANAYDNLISGLRGPVQSPDCAIRTIAQHAKSAFNAEVVVALAQSVSIFPTGSMVRLAECSNRLLEGAAGVIMKPSHEHPHRPIIIMLRDPRGSRTTPKTIDLSAEQHSRLELEL